MKSLLAKIGLPKAVGLCIDDDSITLSEVVSTPFGPIETARYTEDTTRDEVPLVLQRLVRSRLGHEKRCRVPVAISLPPERTYFATRPIQNASSNPSPRVLLREALRSPDVSVDEMAVDVIQAQPDRRLVASIVSCDRKYLGGLLKALHECGVRPYRAEPMPCALLRAAATRHRTRRHSKVVLRLFLGETDLLAVLVVRNLPVVWRFCPLPRGDEAASILSSTRSLLTVSKDCGIESGLDAVMIHGRPDLMRLVDVDWVQEQAAAPVDWFHGPPLDHARVAFGTALGCLKRQEEHTFDLAHGLKPRPSLWEVIPWREGALQIVMLVCMGLFLADRCRVLSEERTAVATQCAEHLWLSSATDAQLEKEKQDLTQKVAAVRKFLDGRIHWTAYERDLSACLPENVFLTSFQGECQFGAGGKQQPKGKPKKSLVIRGSVPTAEDGSIPREVDVLLNTLRAHPRLETDFPVVELADLKQNQSRDDKAPLTSFTVICSPKGGKNPAQ